jgi:hypothetical protein
MLTLTEKLTFEALVKRAGFRTFRQLATELELHGFRTLSDNTLTAWRKGGWRPKLLAKEALILCQVLNCSLEELAEAFEDYQPGD